jgi:hypothetical protein
MNNADLHQLIAILGVVLAFLTGLLANRHTS